MENPFREKSVEAMSLVEKEQFFGRLLSRARSKLSTFDKKGNITNGKFRSEIALEFSSLGDRVTEDSITGWENGTSFPLEDKLIFIARVYRIDLSELENALSISRGAREVFIKNRPHKNSKALRLKNKMKNSPDFPTKGGKSRW